MAEPDMIRRGFIKAGFAAAAIGLGGCYFSDVIEKSMETRTTEWVAPAPDDTLPEISSLDEIIRDEKGRTADEIYLEQFGITRLRREDDQGPKRYEKHIESLGMKYSVPSDLIRAVLFSESGKKQFNATGRVIKSPTGAIGIGQHIKMNIEELNRLWFNNQVAESKRWSYARMQTDALHNMDATAATLRNLIDEFGIQNIETIALAYNAGKTNVRDTLAKLHIKGPNTDQYILDIIKNLKCDRDKIYEADIYAQRIKAFYNLFSQGIKSPIDGTELKYAQTRTRNNINYLVMPSEKERVIHLMTPGYVMTAEKGMIRVKTDFGSAYYYANPALDLPKQTRLEAGTPIGRMLQTDKGFIGGVGLSINGFPYLNIKELLTFAGGYSGK